ncbi:MAG: DUF3575 domain-containing protein [Vicingaceae bacterium]|nr:DUF3575 domain-containing protein [Vicingaceae bacterium]
MKKLIIGALLLSSGLGLKAQHDISLDALGFAFSKYGVGYEYAINSKNSVGINVNFTSKNMFSDMKNQYSFIDGDMDYSEMNIIPEYKSFFTPNKGNDGVYMGIYGKFRTSSSAGNTFATVVDTVPVIGKTDVSSTGIALGAIVGYKWKTSGAMFLEVTAGIGKFLSTSVSYSNSIAEDLDENEFNEDDYIPYIGNELPVDFRLALKIGIRIGSSKE